MPLSSNKDEYTPEEWKAELDKEADACAERHSLDSKRVRKIFHSLDKIEWYLPTSNHRTILDEALAYFRKDFAMSLFENQPLEQIKIRHQAFRSLVNRHYQPFYSITKFADLLDELIEYQLSIRNCLVHTGYTFSTFTESYWMDYHLNRLQYVKSPFDYFRFGIEDDLIEFLNFFDIKPEPDKSLKYMSLVTYYGHSFRTINWNKSEYLCVKDDRLVADYPDDSEGLLAVLQPYSDAPYFDFLPKDMGKQVDDLRGTMFDLRIDVLKSLSNALRLEQVESLWEKCLEIISSKLLYADANLLLKTDSFLSEVKNVPKDHFYQEIAKINLHNAGLSDLFHVIGYIEKELTYRSNQKIMQMLEDIPVSFNKTSYFACWKSPHRSKIKEIIDYQIIRQKQSKSFFDEFNKRVNSALEKKFKGKMEITYKMEDEPCVKAFVENLDKGVAPLMVIGDQLMFSKSTSGKSVKLLPELGKSLSPKQKKDRDKHEYQCLNQVEIPGTTYEKTYDILINEDEFSLEINYFLLFLRLVMELKLNQRGWVDTQGLKKVVDISIPQAIYNLGKKVERSLHNEDRKTFFEYKDKKGYRISTHPDFIKYDKEKLLSHADDRIRKLAEMLPD